jgi:hypothetical protein
MLIMDGSLPNADPPDISPNAGMKPAAQINLLGATGFRAGENSSRTCFVKVFAAKRNCF